MQIIGILSDTHGILNPRVLNFLAPCDQVWHAGDIGNYETARKLGEFKPLKAVYGNVDGTEVRSEWPGHQLFECEGVKVLMIHIGGYPGHYSPEARKLIEQEKPGLFVSGHSHILKVIFDKKYNLLHINPGAAGSSGFHHVITCVRLKIDAGNMSDLEVLEIQRNKNIPGEKSAPGLNH